MNSAPAAIASRATIQLGDRTAGVIDIAAGVDAGPPVVSLPPDLIDALADDGEAAWRFADLLATDQRRLVRAIERAGTAETRHRRIATIVARLRADLI